MIIMTIIQLIIIIIIINRNNHNKSHRAAAHRPDPPTVRREPGGFRPRAGTPMSCCFMIINISTFIVIIINIIINTLIFSYPCRAWRGGAGGRRE